MRLALYSHCFHSLACSPIFQRFWPSKPSFDHFLCSHHFTLSFQAFAEIKTICSFWINLQNDPYRDPMRLTNFWKLAWTGGLLPPCRASARSCTYTGIGASPLTGGFKISASIWEKLKSRWITFGHGCRLEAKKWQFRWGWKRNVPPMNFNFENE